MSKTVGTLVIVGGHENTDGDRCILQYIAQAARARKGALVLVTVATSVPEEVAAKYRRIFQELGVKQMEVLDIRTREDGFADENVHKLMGASVVFFTGGDQLRLTSQLSGSPVFQCLQRFHAHGGTIAGTSAGAAAMPATMIVSGAEETSSTISAVGMAPGLGLIENVVIDSHFAERGRMERLLGAVTQNPRNLGLGIDENTAIVVQRGKTFQVMGSGGLYVLDGSSITFSSLSEGRPEGVMSIYGVTLHVLADGDRYDLQKRCPILSAEPMHMVP